MWVCFCFFIIHTTLLASKDGLLNICTIIIPKNNNPQSTFHFNLHSVSKITSRSRKFGVPEKAIHDHELLKIAFLILHPSGNEADENNPFKIVTWLNSWLQLHRTLNILLNLSWHRHCGFVYLFSFASIKGMRNRTVKKGALRQGSLKAKAI